MQLNSLSLNSNTRSTSSQSQLAIYDHKLAVVNTEVFVYGKTIQNFSIQTPLHKINLMSLRLEPVFTTNAPVFEEFMMFSFEQHIYFCGKTCFSEEIQLFDFDGMKFTKMDQSGPSPRLNGPYSFTKFSHKYLLFFGCLTGIQFLNKWYLFDIKQRCWKQIVSAVQIPVCEKCDLIWKNGRGYLLLQNCYDKTTQRYQKNLLYEIKFQNFNKLVIETIQIPLSYRMRSLDMVFTNLLSVDDNYLMVLGGEEIDVSEQKSQIQKRILVKNDQSQIDLKNQKVIFKLDLQSFLWSTQSMIVSIKGQDHQYLTFENKLYAIGGTFQEFLLRQIQLCDLKAKQIKKVFPYEQSLCYYCECAFTYEQKLIYEPAIEQDYEMFAPKNRIENKFLRKFSQSIPTDLHAIGTLCEYLISQKSLQIQINMCQEINLNPRNKFAKSKIETHPSEILIFKSQFLQSPPLSDSMGNGDCQRQDNDPLSLQNLSISMSRVKIASFKLGYSVLYVTSTSEGHIFVTYSSYSQTEFPQSNFRSFSDISYTVKWNKTQKTYDYSSQNNRNIIFQNVKIHFGDASDYENTKTYQVGRKQIKGHFISIYVIGVINLERYLLTQPTNKCFEDIRLKNLSKNNPTNSLRKYLKHLYLPVMKDFTIVLQNTIVQVLDIYNLYEGFSKRLQIKEIHTNDEAVLKKAENQETHFSTNHDEIVSWKKIESIQNCKLYQILKDQIQLMKNVYNCVFVYYKKKLVKTVTTKKSIICGVIELAQSLVIQLNGAGFAHKSDQRRLIKWLQQIESAIAEQNYPHSTQEV